jgi:perosamine synthetase
MHSNLALFGGKPVREHILPYSRQLIAEEDSQTVADILFSDWLTTGPYVNEFESRLAHQVGTRYAVAVSNGTAALHSALYSLNIETGDEVIVPALTFAATANAVLYVGGQPVFADVEKETLTLDPNSVLDRISPATKAIIAVDYAGHPCHYEVLNQIASERGLVLLADACHSLGAQDNGRPAGSLAELSTFSFHPVKPITTGEGGAVTTDNRDLAETIKRFRNHGIVQEHQQRAATRTWQYEMTELGFNYRLSDIHCALGCRQLEHLPSWVERRNQIARTYDESFQNLDIVCPLAKRKGVTHAYHLYVVQLDVEKLSCARSDFFGALRAEGIGVNVHYIPVYYHPYYRRRFGSLAGTCPVSESAYEKILSLPLFPGMSDQDTAEVIWAVEKVVAAFRS